MVEEKDLVKHNPKRTGNFKSQKTTGINPIHYVSNLTVLRLRVGHLILDF